LPDFPGFDAGWLHGGILVKQFIIIINVCSACLLGLWSTGVDDKDSVTEYRGCSIHVKVLQLTWLSFSNLKEWQPWVESNEDNLF